VDRQQRRTPNTDDDADDDGGNRCVDDDDDAHASERTPTSVTSRGARQLWQTAEQMAARDPLAEPIPEDALARPKTGTRTRNDGNAGSDEAGGDGAAAGAGAAAIDEAELEPDYIDVTAARALRVGALLGFAFLC